MTEFDSAGIISCISSHRKYQLGTALHPLWRSGADLRIEWYFWQKCGAERIFERRFHRHSLCRRVWGSYGIAIQLQNPAGFLFFGSNIKLLWIYRRYSSFRCSSGSFWAHWFCFSLFNCYFIILLFRKPYTYAAQYQSTNIPDEALPGISVVIASKNESENLAKNLPSILEQDYPNYEVIVVNSGSTDETDILLKGLEQKYLNFIIPTYHKKPKRTTKKNLHFR